MTLNKHELVKDMYPLTYDNTYASSILFPFANRIKGVRYDFEGKTYQFVVNEKELNNALHGLVYNCISLKTLQTDKTYYIHWNLNIDNN